MGIPKGYSKTTITMPASLAKSLKIKATNREISLFVLLEEACLDYLNKHPNNFPKPSNKRLMDCLRLYLLRSLQDKSIKAELKKILDAAILETIHKLIKKG